MKDVNRGIIFALCLGLCFLVGKLIIIIPNIDYNIERATNYILSTQEIVSGLDAEIKELRAITDEFRAQIKGLQEMIDDLNKEVFFGTAQPLESIPNGTNTGLTEDGHKNNNKMIIITRDVKTGGNQ